MFIKRVIFFSVVLLVSGCAIYHDVREIKMIGFSEDVSKGKPTGQFESDDCVFQVMGYSLGGAPDISKAIANAQTGKKSKITDVAYASDKPAGPSLRYANNLTANYTGFNAVVFGKRCIEVKGMGYL